MPENFTGTANGLNQLIEQSAGTVSQRDDRATLVTAQEAAVSSPAALVPDQRLVHPDRFADFATRGERGRYEEVLHSLQFKYHGQGRFYDLYVLAAVAGALLGEGPYQGNLVEDQAQEAASRLAAAFQKEKPCG